MNHTYIRLVEITDICAIIYPTTLYRNGAYLLQYQLTGVLQTGLIVASDYIIQPKNCVALKRAVPVLRATSTYAMSKGRVSRPICSLGCGVTMSNGRRNRKLPADTTMGAVKRLPQAIGKFLDVVKFHTSCDIEPATKSTLIQPFRT